MSPKSSSAERDTEHAEFVAAVEEIYAERFSDDAHRKWRAELWQVLVDGYFSRWISRDATVLDFGCGFGEFINAVRAERRIGADLREELKEKLAPGVEFVVPDGPRMPSIGDGEVDVVFCSNLLEHLPDRPTVTALFKEFRRVLRPGGRLLILGPNLRAAGAAYWDFFDHILPFTDRSLVEALATGGFGVETMIPRFLPFTTVGSKPPLFLVRWYLRLPFAWPLFGAQFFAVAKPAERRR